MNITLMMELVNLALFVTKDVLIVLQHQPIAYPAMLFNIE